MASVRLHIDEDKPMPEVPSRSGGTPNESIQPANALGKLVIGTSSTPSAPSDEQPSSSPSQGTAPGAPPASALSNALKQLPALAQSALAAANSALNNSQPPIGNWSQASPELASVLESARNARAYGSTQGSTPISGGD